jgi:transcriptional regulator with XRE-family HTH domain
MADISTARTRVLSVEPKQTVGIDAFVEDVGYLRNRTRLLSADVAETDKQVGEVHHQAFAEQLEVKARQLVKLGAIRLLSELADEGFAWRDIARLVGVSVPALRRWRQGESPTVGHLLAIARMAALARILHANHWVADVASWMEVPLTPGAPLTGLDLAADKRYEDLVDLAAEYATAEDVLDEWQPGWRERYRSDFEVFEAPDGELGIRPVSRELP